MIELLQSSLARFENGQGSGQWVLNARGASAQYLNIEGVGTWSVNKN